MITDETAALIGIIKDINYWPTDKTLKKALGVYGREYISGASPPVRRPGKSGSLEAKVALFQACIGCTKKMLFQTISRIIMKGIAS